MRRVLETLASRVDTTVHPLLDDRAVPRANGRTLLIVVTADRGLCGSFNTNVIKAGGSFITDSRGRQVALALVGRRGRDFFSRRGFQVLFELVNLFGQLKYEHAKTIADAAMEAFTSGEVDAVYLAYNQFRSVMVQQVVVEQLLPIPRGTFDTESQPTGSAPPLEYLFEPKPEQLFKNLLPSYVEVQVFRALLESNAAFYAAQMTAMDAATRNSGEMIEQLTLYMNKVRQAAITREIIEVVSGAQAL
jgi:F-type H+-transporting ATPase subunit gamma